MKFVLFSCLLTQQPFFLEKIIYLFLIALGFHCHEWAFSSCTQASHCNGFSCCGAQALGAQALSVKRHEFSCSEACGIFPEQGSNPCPPALAVRFLSIAPPGKSHSIHSATHELRSNFDFRVLLFKKYISYAIAAMDCHSSDGPG